MKFTGVFCLKDAYNKEKIWRQTVMNNEVLEKVLQFLKQLKGEQTSRRTAVQTPRLKELEKEIDKIYGEYSVYVNKLPIQEQQLFELWVEKTDELRNLQEQNAYCQGYVDCILLLSGLGLLQAGVSEEEFIEMLNQ